MKHKSVRGDVIAVLAISAAMQAGFGHRGSEVAWAIPAQSAALVEEPLHAGPVAAPPSMDGELADPCWREASLASGFMTVEGRWAREQTTVYVGYDDACLYIAFRCNERAPEKIKAVTAKNGLVSLFSDDDLVEFFLDTNHDRKTYYHFAVNARGTRYAASCDTSGKRDDGWNTDWEVKTRIHAQDWTSEIRLPFASLGKARPQPGTAWGVNFNRTRRTGGAVEWSSWAMIAGNFNRPEAFGEMIFGKPASVSYSLDSFFNQQTDQELRITLRNGQDAPAEVRTEWTVSTVPGGARVYGAQAHLGPKEEKKILIPYALIGSMADVPVGSMNAIASSLAVVGAATGERYDFRKGLLETPPTISMDLARYYYTPDVRQVKVGLAGDATNGDVFRVEVSEQPGGKAWDAKEMPFVAGKDEYSASFDVADWAPGRYVVSAHLLGPGGQDKGSIHRVFFKREIQPAAAPPTPVKVSFRPDGILLLGGKPFCPFFASGTDMRSPFATDCFNVRWGEGGLISAPLEMAAAGLPGWTKEKKGGKEETFILMPEEDDLLQSVRNAVASRKPDPRLLFWFLTYESQIPMYRGKEERGRLNNPKELKKISQFVKSIDPDHPTCLELELGDDARLYKDSADIIEVAAWSSSYATQMIPNFIQDVEEARNLFGGKPFFFWIGSSIPSAQNRTAEEIRCASYLALMHGAAGIIYHMGHEGIAPSFTRHWSVYPGLSREIEGLFPIITAPQSAAAPRITVSPASLDCRMRLYEGRPHLIAVNTSNSLVQATISIEDRSVVPKRIEVLFENREIKPEGNEFTDVFTGFEPHVYEFSSVDATRE